MNHKLEIVVVDDEEEITELLRTFILIVGQDICVHTFNDSTVAKDFVLHNPVDVLITDYHMPSLDGLQLMESAPSEVKKVLISGYASEIGEEKLQKLNAVYFEKPVPLRELARVISEYRKKV